MLVESLAVVLEALPPFKCRLLGFGFGGLAAAGELGARFRPVFAAPGRLSGPVLMPGVVGFQGRLLRSEEVGEGVQGLRGRLVAVELARRGQAAEAGPEETNLEWWQRFERDCQAFDRHLANLKAQAETEGQPWPPEPAVEHEVSPEAEPATPEPAAEAYTRALANEPEPEADASEAEAELEGSI